MATDLARLVVTMEANNAKFVKDMESLKKDIKRVQRTTEDATKKAEKRWESFGSNVKKAIGAIGFAALAKQTISFSRTMVEASDSANLLFKRLETFSGSTGAFGAAFNAAQKLGVAVEDVAGGMARFLVVGREIGVTAKEAERLTITFQQLARLGGATGSESSAAFIQLTQALGAGVLRGQELNSILEQAPLVAQAIAKELGVGIGALKRMGEEGKITADIVRTALANAADEANKAFQSLPDTLAQQQARIENAWKLALTGLDNALKSSETWQFFNRKLAEFLEGFAQQTAPINLLSDEQLEKEIKRLKIIRDGNRTIAREFSGGTFTVGAAEDYARLLDAQAELQNRVAQEAKAESEARSKSVASVVKMNELMARPQGTNVGLSAIATSVTENEQAILQAMAKIEMGALKVQTRFIETSGVASEFAVQAARNMQDAFADYFFDPFNNGVDGMVKGLADALRRMLANILASKVLDFIGGALSGYGGILGSIGKAIGARANGGPVTANTPFLVGERGPEIFVPSSSGRIERDVEGGGGSSLVYSPQFNINDDTDLKRALPTILAADKREMMRILSQAMSRSGLPQPVF